MTSQPGAIQQGQYQAQILKEQTRLLFEHLPFVLIGSLVSSSGVTVILWNEVAHTSLLGWTLLVYLLCGLRWKIRQHFMSLGTNYDARKWMRVATVLTASAGLLWGSMGVLFFEDTPLVLMTLVIVLGGMTAGAVSSHSCHLPAYAAFAIPAVTPFALRCFAELDGFHIVLGTLSLTFMLVNILYGRNLQSNLLETMQLRFQNADLIVALTHQKEAVEQASQAKTRFLAAASHDLRQPVQAIELFVDVLDRDLKDTPAVVMLNRIRAAGRGLETLLNALLDFSKIDAAAIKPDKRPFPVQSLFDVLNSDFSAQAERKGLVLAFVPSRH